MKKLIGVIAIYLFSGLITLIASKGPDDKITKIDRCEDLGFIVPKGRNISFLSPHINPTNPVNQLFLSRFYSNIVPWISSRVDKNNQEREARREGENSYRENIFSNSKFVCATLVRVDGIFSFSHFKAVELKASHGQSGHHGHHGHHGGNMETENGIVIEVDQLQKDISDNRAHYQRFVVHYEVQSIRTLFPDDPKYKRRDNVVMGSTLRVYLNQEGMVMFVEFVRPAEYLIHSSEVVDSAEESI